jgi:uncharacterized protein (DUF433 family)
MNTPNPAVHCHPGIMSGVPVFYGTRVPFKTLFDYLETGDSIDDFLEEFPTVTRDLVIAALEQVRLSAPYATSA